MVKLLKIKAVTMEYSIVVFCNTKDELGICEGSKNEDDKYLGSNARCRRNVNKRFGREKN